MTTDKAEWAKKALSTVLRGVEKGLEAVGSKSALLTTLGGHPLSNPLGETYFSQTSFRYGNYAGKFSVVPVSNNLTALKNANVDMAGLRDGLRAEMIKLFATQSATWELRVQLLTDLDAMPIEDSSVLWPEDLSPYRTVATISVAPQVAWSDTRATVGDDRLAFDPWHCLDTHRPLGSINRVRKTAYEMSTGFRSGVSRCPIHEPHEAIYLPVE